MRKHLLMLLALLVYGLAFGNSEKAPLKISVSSYEASSVTGELSITLNYEVQQDMELLSGLEPQLPSGWSVTDWGEMESSSQSAGTTIQRTILISHPIDNLPFYPERISFAYEDQTISKDPVAAEGRVYFTPYNTVEVWSYYDFVHLKRNWYVNRVDNAQRIYVDPASIPSSNIPESYDPQEDWEEDFQSVKIEGLAYSIPMLPIHPDSLNDTINVVIDDTAGRADGCGWGWRRWQGMISGTIVSPFSNEDFGASGNTNRGLEGLRVELWEEDGLWDIRIGFGTTDSDGNFSFNVNTCQFAEGDEAEIYLKIEARNYGYKIKGKNTWTFGSTQIEETSVQDWDYNNGDPDPVNFDTLIIDNGAHRAVSMCVQSWNYTNIYSGITLDKALTVRADLNDGSFFLPDKYCGIPITAAALMGYLVPKFGAILGPIGTVYFISDIIFNTQKPNIFLVESACREENTPRHEFGHFVMWQLQGKCWTDIPSGSFAPHFNSSESNSRIAWTEGWADAFSMIIDAHHRDWDGESGNWGSATSYENRRNFPAINFGPASEYHIACALYDVWDGANKFGHLTGSSPSFADANTGSNPELWVGGQTDQIAYSFETICDIIANGDQYGVNNQIESIQEFYKQLIEPRGCTERSLIKQVFDQNRVIGIRANFPNGDYRGFTSDEIAASDVHPYSGFFAGVGTFNGFSWSYNFTHEYDATFLWTSAQDYNLAALNVNGYKFLSDNLTVKDGATLHFNRNIPIKWVAAGSPQRPALNSTMDADLCGDMTLKVFQDGHVIVGDQAVSAHADVRLNGGSTLILGGNSTSNNGELRINNNSRFYVEEGAHLIIDQGANIVLNGNNAVLEIDGDMTIMPGATFTFSGSGHVVFGNDFWNQTVNTSATSEIDLHGSGQSDLILVLKDGCHWWNSGQTARFDIHDGLVRLGNDANILMNAVNIRLEDVDVTNNGGGLHKGIITTGQAWNNHTISNADFSNGHYGLRAYQIWGTGGYVKLDHCDFVDCGIGIEVHAGAARMDFCSFTSCETGYLQQLGAFPSRLYQTDLIENNTGIDFRTGSGDLVLHSCNVNSNYLGVRMDGPGTIRGKCSNINNNDTYGLLLLSGAFADLSDNVDDAGTQFKIRDNGTYSMYSFVGAGLNFFHGSNDFVPAVENNNRVIAGAVLGSCSTPLLNNAERNHWNTRTTDPKGDVPVSGTDYLLYVVDQWPGFTCIQNFSFTDPLRYAPSPYCSYGMIGGGSGSDKLTANPLRECGSCREIVLANGDAMYLNQAVLTALMTLEEFNADGDNMEALGLLNEVLASPLENLSEEERYVVDVAIEMAHYTFADEAAQGNVSFENYQDASLCDPNVAGILGALELKASLIGEGPAGEIVGMERAMIDRLASNYLAANTQLDALQTNGATGLEPWMDYASCYMDVEAQLLEGLISWDEFEAQVAYCVASKTDPAMEDMDLAALKPAEAGAASALALSIHPNPAMDRAILTLDGKDAKITDLRVHDAQGRIVDLGGDFLPSPEGQERRFLDLRGLPAGLYFVGVNTAAGWLTQKLVVR